jgi:galactitol-specific phosphotransferase system IIB component
MVHEAISLVFRGSSSPMYEYAFIVETAMRQSTQSENAAAPSILFVCRHGSVKSVFARETLRRLAAEQGFDIEVRSCGISPENHVTASLEAALRRDGIALSREPSAALAQKDLDDADIVVVFDELPAALGLKRVIDWTDVPSMVENYAAARAALLPRLQGLLGDVLGGAAAGTKPKGGLVSSLLQELFEGRRPSRWVTRERPKIDRVACPWLIRRFIDQDAEFLFVPTEKVFQTAERERAVAFDIPGASFSHQGEHCSFDAFVERFGIDDSGIRALQPIIRGADTDRHDLAPEAAGLHALSLGLSVTHHDDQALLAQGLVIYDAFYAWAIKARGERHAWKP